MLGRLKATILDFIRQADLVLLALCCAAGGCGLVLICSTSRRWRTAAAFLRPADWASQKMICSISDREGKV